MANSSMPITAMNGAFCRKFLAVCHAECFLTSQMTLKAECGTKKTAIRRIFQTTIKFNNNKKHYSWRLITTLNKAVAGAECNTVIELKLEHHAA
ncbi:hypothetical protein HBN88_24245 [Pseudomonas fragi]|jgi:hypothetical protein|nr:hypothetical protein [Pseudomonas fragi]NNB37070.1 hypothetical protein [Pseudomonas fragi]